MVTSESLLSIGSTNDILAKYFLKLKVIHTYVGFGWIKTFAQINKNAFQ